jgi:Transposase DDE domain
VLSTLCADVVSTMTVLDLYRARWQIELAFKRLKSLLSAGHVPKHNDRSAHAWIQGKLLTVLLIERLLEEARFFPPGALRSPRRSRWREFLEARDSLYAVLSLSIPPTQFVQRGTEIMQLLQSHPRERPMQLDDLLARVDPFSYLSAYGAAPLPWLYG